MTKLNEHDCALSILVARPDVGFMMQTIPHIVRMCAYPFAERILVVDTASLHSRYESQPGVGSKEQLIDSCDELVRTGVMDRIWEVDYSDSCRRSTYARHLTSTARETRDWRGVPLLARMAAIDICASRYFVHFDSDILLHQTPGYDWVRRGIELLGSVKDVMFVSPLAGPPTRDGSLRQRGNPYREDPGGFYRIESFTSRKYLLDRVKLEEFLPLRPMYLSWKRRLLNSVTGRSAILSWEMMVAQRLVETGFTRADLKTPEAWTLHTLDHGPAFLEKLPEIIGLIEKGWYPPEQAGDYDLRLETWLAAIQSGSYAR